MSLHCVSKQRTLLLCHHSGVRLGTSHLIGGDLVLGDTLMDFKTPIQSLRGMNEVGTYNVSMKYEKFPSKFPFLCNISRKLRVVFGIGRFVFGNPGIHGIQMPLV